MNREYLLNIFNAALKAANPYNAVKKMVPFTDDKLRVNASIVGSLS